MLELSAKGVELYEDFQNKRIISTDVNFHEPIKRNGFTTFKNLRKTTMKKTKDIQVNRNIIASLLAFSLKHEKVIDMENALKYLLNPIPLSIANADGSRRETLKSALAKIILPKTATNAVAGKGTVIIGFIAQHRKMKCIPGTYKN